MVKTDQVYTGELYCYIVMKVPSCMSEGALEESESNAAHVIGL